MKKRFSFVILKSVFKNLYEKNYRFINFPFRLFQHK